ncbi:hypothetical protein V4762_00085 [Thermodesulfobium sp. 4217-1]
MRKNKKATFEKIAGNLVKVKYGFSYFTFKAKSKIKEFIIYFGEQNEY